MAPQLLGEVRSISYYATKIGAKVAIQARIVSVAASSLIFVWQVCPTHIEMSPTMTCAFLHVFSAGFTFELPQVAYGINYTHSNFSAKLACFPVLLTP